MSEPRGGVEIKPEIIKQMITDIQQLSTNGQKYGPATVPNTENNTGKQPPRTETAEQPGAGQTA